jgi:hypothetical protein
MRTPSSARWSSLRVALLIFVALGVVLLQGTFRHFDYIGAKDWNAMLGQAQAELTTLRDYGQLPLWNPWRAGGQVSLAQPESMFFSPITPMAMLFGVVPAFKLAILPVFVVGCLGMWAFAGHLGLGGPARLVPALVFFGASSFPLYVSGGLPNWLFGLTLLPWLLLLNRRAVSDPRYVVFAAATYAGLLFCGSIYHFVFFPLVLGLDSACVAVCKRSMRPLFTTLAVFLAGVALAGVRVVPLLEVFLQIPRELPATSRYLTWPLVVRAFLGSELPDLATLNGPWVSSGATVIYWNNAGSYIGPLAVALAAVGAFFRARATWGFAMIGVLFLWLAHGSGVPLSLWDALHHLPVFGSMQAPARLILVVTFTLAILAGWGFYACDQTAWAARLSAPQRQALRVLVLFATVLPMLIVNAPIAATAFTVEPRPGVHPGGWFSPREERPAFQQTKVLRHPAQFEGDLLYAVLRNRGNVAGQTEFPTRARVRPRGEPGYRGEVYLMSGGGDASAEITPNLIRVRADVAKKDVLVVNQAYFPGWRAEGSVSGELVPSSAGLLSIEVPPGRHVVTLRYRPRSFLLGAGLSAATAAIALLFLWIRREEGGPSLLPDNPEH